jgi:uncharacterized protein (TIGR02391 family)
MANLTTNEKQILEKLFQMSGGYVLNFTDRTMVEFFKDDVGVDIYEEKYNYASGSKANRMRGFWREAENIIVGESIIKLVDYIRNQILLGELKEKEFPEKLLQRALQIARKLATNDNKSDFSSTSAKPIKTLANQLQEAKLEDGKITITLHKQVFDHVQKLLNDGHYFNAVEEAYKIVRSKLCNVSGSEKATNAFKEANYERIFGHKPVNQTERDFYEGVKFLHMAIQFLRNEKAHTPAYNLDKNLAIHYIALASLAYDLIDR